MRELSLLSLSCPQAPNNYADLIRSWPIFRNPPLVGPRPLILGISVFPTEYCVTLNTHNKLNSSHV